MLTKAVDIYANHPQILISMLGRAYEGELIKAAGIDLYKKGNLITVDASPRYGNSVYSSLKKGGVTYLKDLISDL